MTTADICGTAAAIACLIAAVCMLRLRVYRRDIERLSTVRTHLVDRNNNLRNEVTIAVAERDAAIAELEPATTEVSRLRAELEKSLRWRNELRQAEDETYLMQQPTPRNERQPRPKDSWVTHMNARFQAPAVVPPHEQGGDPK